MSREMSFQFTGKCYRVCNLEARIDLLEGICPCKETTFGFKEIHGWNFGVENFILIEPVGNMQCLKTRILA